MTTPEKVLKALKQNRLDFLSTLKNHGVDFKSGYSELHKRNTENGLEYLFTYCEECVFLIEHNKKSNDIAECVFISDRWMRETGKGLFENYEKNMLHELRRHHGTDMVA